MSRFTWWVIRMSILVVQSPYSSRRLAKLLTWITQSDPARRLLRGEVKWLEIRIIIMWCLVFSHALSAPLLWQMLSVPAKLLTLQKTMQYYHINKCKYMYMVDLLVFLHWFVDTAWWLCFYMPHFAFRHFQKTCCSTWFKLNWAFWKTFQFIIDLLSSCM